ncbi:MAG TPA: hypothetical protein VHR66_03590 [Gemmataceae bacterium]|jgi:hypothetical protein|nr:hypothetical protein [Gemmataceae bacterium]
MKAIGFRADPNALYWAVVSDGPLQRVASGKLPAPAKYEEPAALSWYRTEVRNLIDEFSPDCAGVRYPEPSARVRYVVSAHARVRIEGVVLEAIDSKALPVLVGANATISSKLESKSAKAYLDTSSFRGIDWTALSDEIRQAVLVAAAAIGSQNA